MGKMRLDVDSLSVVSYVTAPDVRDAQGNSYSTRTWGCTQTTQCSNCTLLEAV